MKEFTKVKASARAISRRRQVYGVGVNDAWYAISQTINGKSIKCNSYDRWKIMLARCYSKAWQAKKPTYEGCTVCNEWLSFSNFDAWFNENYVEGYELDKDLKVKGNKMYSPETCLFVPSKINSLFSDCGSARGKLPIGVTEPREGRYVATVSIDGKGKKIGTFDTIGEACKEYRKAKNIEVLRKCVQYPEFADLLKKRLINA